MLIDCLSCCAGFAAAFGRLEGVPSLILWEISDGKRNRRHQDGATFLDMACILFCTSTSICEKFTFMDMKLCSMRGISKVVIIGTTRSRMQRYELSLSLGDNHWECVNFAEIDNPDLSYQLVTFSGTAAISGSFDSSSGSTNNNDRKQSLVIRSHLLETIKGFDCIQSNLTATATALIFYDEELLLAAFEKGKILGWNIRNDNLMFDCDLSLTKSLVCSISVINIKFKDGDKYLPKKSESDNRDVNINNNENSKYNRGHDKDYRGSNCNNTTNSFDLTISLAIGYLDGRLKMIEIDQKDKSNMIVKENGNIDLQRDTRYLNRNSEINRNTSISSCGDFNTSSSQGYYNRDEKNIRLNQDDIMPSVRKESSFIPIAMKYIEILEKNDFIDSEIPVSESVRSNVKGGVRALNCNQGIIMVATASSLLLISIMPFQIMRYIPLSSLSVSTISAACTCYNNRNENQSIDTLLMTAFEKKIAVYSFSLEDPKTSSSLTPPKVGSVQISSRTKEDSYRNVNDFGDDYEDTNYIQDGSNKNCNNKEIHSHVEVDGEVMHDSMKSTEIMVSKNRGKWLFPTPISSTSLPLRDCDHESQRDRNGVFSNKKNSVNDNDSENNDDDDNNDHDDDKYSDNNYTNNNDDIHMKKNPSQKNIKKSLYADFTIPLSLFPVEGMFFDNIGKKGLTHESNNERNDEDHNSRNSNSDRVIVSPLLPKIISKNSQVNGRNQSTSAATITRCKERGSWENPVKDSMGRLIDQPITFRSNLRSSGYGQQILDKKVDRSARRKSNPNISSPVVSNSKMSNISNNCISGSDKDKNKPCKTSGPRLRLYPSESQPTTHYQSQNDFPAIIKGGPSPPPIYDIAYSSDASLLAIATTDATVSTLKLPVSKSGGNGQSYSGHNGRVTGVCFSLNRKILLSSSTDGSAMVWSSDCTDSPAVVINHTKHQPSASATSTSTSGILSAQSSSSNPCTKVSSFTTYTAAIAGVNSSIKKRDSKNRPFGAEVNCARFFYMDKFIMLSVKSSVNMYTYQNERNADTTKPPIARGRSHSYSGALPSGTVTTINDLKKNQSTGLYERTCEWKLSPAQSVTALACVNSVLSPIALCATSDRKFHVLDAAVGCIARTIDCYHDKAVHCIAQPTPSIHCQVSSESYNIFAMAATDNVISLWDLRSPSVVFRYNNHVNRRERISIALSPCLRFLACGSEDRTARIVDLRGGKEIVKLQGHKDVVSGIAFNPLFPQLATCSFDGTIRFYVDPTIAPNTPGI